MASGGLIGDTTSAAATTGGEAAGGREPLRYGPFDAGLWRPVTIFVAFRLLVVATIALADLLEPDGPGGAAAGLGAKLRFWDGDFYLDVARAGYPAFVPQDQNGLATQSSLAFFPLYPALIRLFDTVLPGGELAAAMVVSFLFGTAATVLLWLLVRALSGHTAADRATVFFCAFPGAFVWSMVYAEPVMVAFAIACCMALLARYWLLAGALAAIGTATRPNAVVLVACCAWAAGLAIQQRREWRALVAPVLAPIGWLATLAYLARHTGETGAWFRVEREGWGESVDLGRRTLSRIQTLWQDFPADDLDRLLPTLGLVLVALMAWCLWRWRPPSVLWVWAAGIIALAVTSRGLGLRPRFVHAAFPLLAATGWWLRGRWFAVVVSLAAAAQVGLAYLSVTSTRAIP